LDPHSGIATFTYALNAGVAYEDTSFQLWLSLPPELENGPDQGITVAPEAGAPAGQRAGAARPLRREQQPDAGTISHARAEAIKLFPAKRREGWRSRSTQWAQPLQRKPRGGMGGGSMGPLVGPSCF
jgi:hypothetical protein